MLRNPQLGILQLSVFAAPAAVYIPIFYVPLFFQFARSESPVTAATRLLPFVVLTRFPIRAIDRLYRLRPELDMV